MDGFERARRAGRYAYWVPGVSRSEMARFYGHGSFLLNASLVEVSPLVDIEALAYGCPVATTRYALNHALLPRDTPICDPYDEQHLTDQLQSRPARLVPRAVVDAEQCRRDLVESYRELMNRVAR